MTEGDHQLPPIGLGMPFQDIINSGIAVTFELDIVQRQSETTGIPEYSCEIRFGRVPSDLSIGNIVFHEIDVDDIPDKRML
jgi:exodeoxyribonuclease V alpha subunit